MTTAAKPLDLIKLREVPSGYRQAAFISGVVTRTTHGNIVLSCGVPKRWKMGRTVPVYAETEPFHIHIHKSLTPGLYDAGPVVLKALSFSQWQVWVWGCGGRKRCASSDEVDKAALLKCTGLSRPSIDQLWGYAVWHVPYNEVRGVIDEAWRAAAFLNLDVDHCLRTAIERNPQYCY